MPGVHEIVNNMVNLQLRQTIVRRIRRRMQKVGGATDEKASKDVQFPFL